MEIKGIEKRRVKKYNTKNNMKFLKNNYKKILIGLIIFALIFWIYKSKAKDTSTTVFDPKKDTIYTPKIETIKDELTLAGSVDASSKADLSFQTPGQLNWVGVKVGDKVKKFQAIANLNKDQLKKQLETNFNNYKSALTTFDDTNDKYKTVLNDEIKRILERNQNTLDNSVISYELNDLAIKYATLVTPIEGIVTRVDNPVASQNITPASVISVIDPKSIFFKSQIDQEDVIKIKVGQKTTIILDSYPDKTFDTKVSYIAFTPVTGQSSTVYEIHFEMPNSENGDLQYRLGMDGDAKIELNESQDALTISTDAVNDDNGQKYVYLKEDKKLVRRNVTIGIETDTNTEIKEGITQNDQIVVIKK